MVIHGEIRPQHPEWGAKACLLLCGRPEWRLLGEKLEVRWALATSWELSQRCHAIDHLLLSSFANDWNGLWEVSISEISLWFRGRRQRRLWKSLSMMASSRSEGCIVMMTMMTTTVMGRVFWKVLWVQSMVALRVDFDDFDGIFLWMSRDLRFAHRFGSRLRGKK